MILNFQLKIGFDYFSSFSTMTQLKMAQCLRRIMFWMLALSLVHCTSYTPPTANVPSSWDHAVKNTLSSHTGRWWLHFHSSLLNELIEYQALNNLDIQMAQARVNAAREQYHVAFSQLFPSVNANVMPPNGTGFDLTQVLALSAAIEPDFFGKQRAGRQFAKANLKIQLAERDHAVLTLQAEIASSYLELREIQTKNRLLQQNLHNNRDMLRFLKSRYKIGLTNYIDVAQQDALIETQLAEVEQNNAMILMLIHKLEILTGSNPGLLVKKLLPYEPIPHPQERIHLGIPAELLARRPDIVAASERVAAAHANISVAMANLFPQITVGWLLGWQTQTISSALFAMQQPESTFFGTMAAPLFNLTLYRMVDLRKREKTIAVIQYQIAVMRALHDVEGHYTLYRHYKKSMLHLERAVKQKRLIFVLAKNTYEKESTDFSTVLRAEDGLHQLEMSYLHMLLLYQQEKINLYKALGGDWDPSVISDVEKGKAKIIDQGVKRQS